MSKQAEWTGERLETFVLNEVTIEHLHRYALAMELAAGKNVLDIACGEGYGTNLLATKAAHVSGMDIDRSTIEKAKAKYNKNNISFTESRGENISANDHEFDLVASFETLEHLSDHASMLKEIKRVLKPGGLLIISTPDKKTYTDGRGYKNPFHVKELYHDEFDALLKSEFNHVEIYNQQITHSSLIKSAMAAGLDIYTGDFDKIEKNKLTQPVYFIALASDGELPALPISLFSGNLIIEQEFANQKKMVRDSFTYKLGHFILYPFKLVRKLIKK
jgi:ubiquinone/menaquinone biosynthesis C-methylase UbiE